MFSNNKKHQFEHKIAAQYKLTFTQVKSDMDQILMVPSAELVANAYGKE